MEKLAVLLLGAVVLKEYSKIVQFVSCHFTEECGKLVLPLITVLKHFILIINTYYHYSAETFSIHIIQQIDKQTTAMDDFKCNLFFHLLVQ